MRSRQKDEKLTALSLMKDPRLKIALVLGQVAFKGVQTYFDIKAKSTVRPLSDGGTSVTQVNYYNMLLHLKLSLYLNRFLLASEVNFFSRTIVSSIPSYKRVRGMQVDSAIAVSHLESYLASNPLNEYRDKPRTWTMIDELELDDYAEEIAKVLVIPNEMFESDTSFIVKTLKLKSVPIPTGSTMTLGGVMGINDIDAKLETLVLHDNSIGTIEDLTSKLTNYLLDTMSQLS